MVPTREHWRIEKWAHDHGAAPAQIKPLKFDGEPAILTFVFGRGDEALPLVQPISWETFFAFFDLLELSMAFDEASTDFCIVKVNTRSASALVQ